MPSFLDQLKKAQEQATNNNQTLKASQPAAPAPRTAATPEEVPDATVKQKYSIYLTDAQREFMENYWHANRHKKQTPGKPKKKINYSDIIAEALELLAEKNGFTI